MQLAGFLRALTKQQVEPFGVYVDDGLETADGASVQSSPVDH